MKTFIKLLAAAFLITSCNKQNKTTPPRYQCYCNVEVGTGIANKNNTYTYENMTRDEAAKQCSSRSGIRTYGFDSYDETWTCGLK